MTIDPYTGNKIHPTIPRDRLLINIYDPVTKTTKRVLANSLTPEMLAHHSAINRYFGISTWGPDPMIEIKKKENQALAAWAAYDKGNYRKTVEEKVKAEAEEEYRRGLAQRGNAGTTVESEAKAHGMTIEEYLKAPVKELIRRSKIQALRQQGIPFDLNSIGIAHGVRIEGGTKGLLSSPRTYDFSQYSLEELKNMYWKIQDEHFIVANEDKLFSGRSIASTAPYIRPGLAGGKPVWVNQQANLDRSYAESMKRVRQALDAGVVPLELDKMNAFFAQENYDPSGSSDPVVKDVYLQVKAMELSAKYGAMGEQIKKLGGDPYQLSLEFEAKGLGMTLEEYQQAIAQPLPSGGVMIDRRNPQEVKVQRPPVSLSYITKVVGEWISNGQFPNDPVFRRDYIKSYLNGATSTEQLQMVIDYKASRSSGMPVPRLSKEAEAIRKSLDSLPPPGPQNNLAPYRGPNGFSQSFGLTDFENSLKREMNSYPPVHPERVKREQAIAYLNNFLSKDLEALSQSETQAYSNFDPYQGQRINGEATIREIERRDLVYGAGGDEYVKESLPDVLKKKGITSADVDKGVQARVDSYESWYKKKLSPAEIDDIKARYEKELVANFLTGPDNLSAINEYQLWDAPQAAYRTQSDETFKKVQDATQRVKEFLDGKIDYEHLLDPNARPLHRFVLTPLDEYISSLEPSIKVSQYLRSEDKERTYRINAIQDLNKIIENEKARQQSQSTAENDKLNNYTLRYLNEDPRRQDWANDGQGINPTLRALSYFKSMLEFYGLFDPGNKMLTDMILDNGAGSGYKNHPSEDTEADGLNQTNVIPRMMKFFENETQNIITDVATNWDIYKEGSLDGQKLAMYKGKLDLMRQFFLDGFRSKYSTVGNVGINFSPFMSSMDKLTAVVEKLEKDGSIDLPTSLSDKDTKDYLVRKYSILSKDDPLYDITMQYAKDVSDAESQGGSTEVIATKKEIARSKYDMARLKKTDPNRDYGEIENRIFQYEQGLKFLTRDQLAEDFKAKPEKTFADFLGGAYPVNDRDLTDSDRISIAKAREEYKKYQESRKKEEAFIKDLSSINIGAVIEEIKKVDQRKSLWDFFSPEALQFAKQSHSSSNPFLKLSLTDPLRKDYDKATEDYKKYQESFDEEGESVSLTVLKARLPDFASLLAQVVKPTNYGDLSPDLFKEYAQYNVGDGSGVDTSNSRELLAAIGTFDMVDALESTYKKSLPLPPEETEYDKFADFLLNGNYQLVTVIPEDVRFFDILPAITPDDVDIAKLSHKEIARYYADFIKLLNIDESDPNYSEIAKRYTMGISTRILELYGNSNREQGFQVYVDRLRGVENIFGTLGLDSLFKEGAISTNNGQNLPDVDPFSPVSTQISTQRSPFAQAGELVASIENEAAVAEVNMNLASQFPGGAKDFARIARGAADNARTYLDSLKQLASSLDDSSIDDLVSQAEASVQRADHVASEVEQIAGIKPIENEQTEDETVYANDKIPEWQRRLFEQEIRRNLMA